MSKTIKMIMPKGKSDDFGRSRPSEERARSFPSVEKGRSNGTTGNAATSVTVSQTAAAAEIIAAQSKLGGNLKK